MRPRSRALKFALAASADIIEAYLSFSNVMVRRQNLHIASRYEPLTGPLPLLLLYSMQHQELHM